MSKKEIESDDLSIDLYVPGIARQPNESFMRFFFRQLSARKNVDTMIKEGETNELKKNLNVFHLTCIGIGCIIGSGIFVYSGIVAAKNAGPAVVLSFLLGGTVASLAALCYAEIASMIPVAGSAYSYTYATMGEFIAWIVGWVLVLEYMVGSAAVGVGWSGYLIKFFHDAFGVQLDKKLIGSFVIWSEEHASFSLTSNYFNLPALTIITLMSILLIIGTKESASVTAIVVVIKVSVILIFIFGATSDVNPSNWVPFIPPSGNDYYGQFGIMGIFKGASIVFFCYTGFDSISTATLEAKNPKRDMPISIIASLTVSTLLYVVVSLVMVGIAPYTMLNVPQPITVAIEFIGKKWLGIIVGLGAVLGMVTTIITDMMAQTRIFYSMSQDGLLPGFFGKVHPKYKTPYVSQAIVGTLSALIAAIFPVDVLGELTGMGTLLGFCLVCLGTMILRVKRPDLPRGFKVPFGPYVIPLTGSVSSAILIFTSSPTAILRLFIWIGIGIIIYFSYGYRYSRLNRPDRYNQTTKS